MSPTYQQTACEARPRRDHYATFLRPFPYLLEAVLWQNVPGGGAGVSSRMRFVFGEYELEPESRTLKQRGERVPVEPKVFDLLVYLIEHRERVVSPNDLFDTLWPGVSVTPAALTRTVQKARAAVGDDGEHQTVLRTEHGHGFRFVAEVSVAPAPLADPQAIAVLPFVNMSGDPQQEFFSDGISEELLNTLTAIEGLRVVGRTSSFSFKGKDLDLRTIGESLGVTNILEGSVRQSGGRIRITAQLISAANGFRLWSNAYDRELADIFETQEEIAGEIARALQVELGFRVAQSVARRTTDNLAAYTWTLRGADLFSRSDVTNLKKARAFFKKAIELDPEYVPAYVGHARASVELFWWGLGPAGDLLDDAERSLREAELLDPGSSAVHATRGMVGAYRNDWVGAERAFKKALELDPNDY